MNVILLYLFVLVSFLFPVVYSTLDMLSTYSFMYPLRLLGLEPADREANKLLAKLVRKNGVERGIVGYWFVETFGLLFLFLIFASVTLYVPIGATSLIALDAATIYALFRIVRPNFKQGAKLNQQLMNLYGTGKPPA